MSEAARLQVDGDAGLTGALRLVELQTIPMENGILGVAEVSKHIGFPVHRAYYIRDVPPGQGRGGHAHKALRQCFLCLRGSFALSITKNGQTETVVLDRPDLAAIVEPGCWRDLSGFSEDAVVVVLASDEYDEADYLRRYDDFLTWEADGEPVISPPYLDLTRNAREMAPELEQVIRRVLRSGHFIGGPEVERFETRFAGYCGAAHMVGAGNGLDALVLALKAWGIGAGDEVIIPAHTFIATALAVDETGATPVLVDVEPDTGLMDVVGVAEAITKRTRAVIPVHLYGHPVDMDGLKSAIAGRDDIRVLEDACQAHGARYKGSRCGALGDAAAFSFYPTKNLGALGDGGGLTTNDAAFAQTVRMLGNYGSRVKYEHELAGRNSRLDPIQAAILDAKLERLDAWNAMRSQLALRYFRGLADLPGVDLPAVRTWAEPVWHVFAVRVPGRRAELQAYLAESGVGTNVHYPTPVHLQPCYAGRWQAGDFPVAEAMASSVLSLPLDHTHTVREIDFVIERVRAFFGRSVAL
ncbi:DegT/DnrJ/EryC1/StrS family aminotransferase [Phenylobacterium sp.]|uniref:DegT/DnrJ/EryC1/StrS family aminotransferase n=1 Tax=Phenylobacterium sp. TaxID=1871053 RepID=UPI00281187CE|nr:DegT/DnrJ/EryC1/StrS family aminotransferase [Phenylobacterium sp.]